MIDRMNHEGHERTKGHHVSCSPGKILSIEGVDPLLRSGRVDFAGIVKQVNWRTCRRPRSATTSSCTWALPSAPWTRKKRSRSSELLRQMGELAELDAREPS